MHSTDDVHERGALMVARAAKGDEVHAISVHDMPNFSHRIIDPNLVNLIASATFAKQVLRSQHKSYGDIVAREAARDLGEAIRALSASDAALARAIDAVPGMG